MNMKGHIIQAMRELFEQWQELLNSLTEEQIHTALEPSHWTVKDAAVHMAEWQQRANARMDAARLNHEPVFPDWPRMSSNDEVNAWLYDKNHDMNWEEAYRYWQESFIHFLNTAVEIQEKDLLDAGRYGFMKGRPLALVLTGTYEHYLEHLENLTAWLDAHGIKAAAKE